MSSNNEMNNSKLYNDTVPEPDGADEQTLADNGQVMAEEDARQSTQTKDNNEYMFALKKLEAELKAETERREAAEAKLVGVQARFDEAKASLERETAEMRTRLMRTLEDRAKQAQFDFLLTLLPVLDNLNRAVTASEMETTVDHLREGVIGTARSFEHALANVGVKPVPALGEVFNPEVHEAVEMKEVEDPAMDGRVTEEYSRGYLFGERLLRPARVQVGKAIARSVAE